MDCGLAMIVKQRAKANEIERMDLVGSVDGCDAIIGEISPHNCYYGLVAELRRFSCDSTLSS